MKRFVAAVIASIALADAHAQPAAVASAAVNNPDESSPFFLTGQQETLLPVSKTGNSPANSAKKSESVAFWAQTPQNKALDVSSGYPKAKRNSDSSTDPALAQVGKFFTGMFSSVRWDSVGEKQPASSLSVDPSSPELNEARDVNVTYTVRNTSNKLTRLEFPSSQRTEFLTRKASGEVIDRWSDDRAFEAEEEIVVINPQERIEYQAKIPTRDMKAGESYNVEASMKTTPDFGVKQAVNPR